MEPLTVSINPPPSGPHAGVTAEALGSSDESYARNAGALESPIFAAPERRATPPSMAAATWIEPMRRASGGGAAQRIEVVEM